MTHTKIYWGIAVALALWLVGSVAMGSLGLFDQPGQPPTYFGLFIGGPIAAFFALYWLSAGFRQALFAIPLQYIVAVHVLRFVGIFFILDAVRHVLPAQFGWPAGIGDIVAAAFSIPIAYLLAKGYRSKKFRAGFVAWNIFGLVDLSFALLLGLLYSESALGFLSQPGVTSQAIVFMPLSLIPTFYVPLLIMLHFIALRRNRESQLAA